jgi:hypothetical protein
MKPKAESKLLDEQIDGVRGLERLKKLGRFVLATPKETSDDQKQHGRTTTKRRRSG